jgi:hypothetical protein
VQPANDASKEANSVCQQYPQFSNRDKTHCQGLYLEDYEEDQANEAL